MRTVVSMMMVVMLLAAVETASAAKKEGAEKAPKAPKEKKEKQPPKEKAPEKEVSVTGVVTQAGKGYALTTEGGKVALPAKGTEQLADMVGKTVTVVGMGTETAKGDKVQIKITKVTSISAAEGGGDEGGGGMEEEAGQGGGGMEEGDEF